MDKWGESRLPTVGDERRMGLSGFFVRCLTYGCPNPPRRFGYDELGLADETVFVEIATCHRRFVCRVCGARSTDIDADWRDYRAQGNGHQRLGARNLTSAPAASALPADRRTAVFLVDTGLAGRLAVDHGPAKPGIWGRSGVEARLVAAFRRMPSCPVYGQGGRARAVLIPRGDPDDVTAVLAWGGFLDGDADARKILWAWARCRATRESFGALFREMGWARATAEAARRRGAEAIATGLNQASDDVAAAAQP